VGRKGAWQRGALRGARGLAVRNAEGRGEAKQAGSAFEAVWQQGQGQKDVFGHIISGAKAEPASGRESEAGMPGGMPYERRRPEPRLAGTPKAPCHRQAADPLVLPGGQHACRAQGEHLPRPALRLNRRPTKEDVAHNTVTCRRHQRHSGHEGLRIPKRVHEVTSTVRPNA